MSTSSGVLHRENRLAIDGEAEEVSHLGLREENCLEDGLQGLSLSIGLEG